MGLPTPVHPVFFLNPDPGGAAVAVLITVRMRVDFLPDLLRADLVDLEPQLGSRFRNHRVHLVWRRPVVK